MYNFSTLMITKIPIIYRGNQVFLFLNLITAKNETDKNKKGVASRPLFHQKISFFKIIKITKKGRFPSFGINFVLYMRNYLEE